MSNRPCVKVEKQLLKDRDFVNIAHKLVFVPWKNVYRKKTKSIDNKDFRVKILISRKKKKDLTRMNDKDRG